MSTPLLIVGGRIIDPSQGMHMVGDLLIAEGSIVWVGPSGETMPPEPCHTLHAQGMIISPGFIDIHCHLREPGEEHKESIATGTRAAAKGGYTTLCCMPNTTPPIDSLKIVDYIKAKTKEEGAVRVLPIGCVTQGRKGESLADMEELARAGAVGFSDDGAPVMDAALMRQALQRSHSIGLPVIDHCEDTSLSQGGTINEGQVAIQLGLKGIPAAAEEAMVARDIGIAEDTSGQLHIAHVSTAGSVELIRQAKGRGASVTAEVTPHHLTLTEECIVTHSTKAKVNPPLRTQGDVEALIEGLHDETIDAIATDHAPHTIADKEREFATAAFGISGLETAFGVLMGLAHAGKIDLVTLLSKLTFEPAQIIAGKRSRNHKAPMKALGTLAVGAVADVTIIDPEAEWTVNPEDFVSKGKNTPWAGCQLKGNVVMTIMNGKVIYSSNTI
jgi:dihydroorotase